MNPKSLDNLKPFEKGDKWKGNKNGRPPGAISVIKRVREKFADNPEAFEAFIAEYIEDPANRKHVVEMLDGKPQQKVDVTSKGESITGIEYLPPANGEATTNTND